MHRTDKHAYKHSCEITKCTIDGKDWFSRANLHATIEQTANKLNSIYHEIKQTFFLDWIRDQITGASIRTVVLKWISERIHPDLTEEDSEGPRELPDSCSVPGTWRKDIVSWEMQVFSMDVELLLLQATLKSESQVVEISSIAQRSSMVCYSAANINSQ